MSIRVVDSRLVDTDIFSTRFACDLSRCKGACCTMPGGRGAPLQEDEVEHVLQAEESAMTYLDETKKTIIREHGSVEGRTGDRATRCVDDRDCVFVFFQNGVATCAIEKAWQEGKSEFRKPLSCHLFPVRVEDLFGGDHLRYEQIPECAPALERGEREGVPLIDFLKDALIRAFGESFYRELCDAMDDDSK